MSTYSVVLKRGWSLRITRGRLVGKEVDLPLGTYVMGSQPPSSLLVNEQGVAPQHLTISVTSTGVSIRDTSGNGFEVNGGSCKQAQVRPGDILTVGCFGFQMVNPALAAASGSRATRTGLPAKFMQLDPAIRVTLMTFAVASVMFLTLLTTGNPNLVPVTLIAMSAVVPSGVMTHLVAKYDKTGISFRTLALTFILGGSVGIICTVVLERVAAAFTFGLLSLPLFAGLYEEPAKLLATSWRWRHPAYDRPMDGLIIGAISGFGFAVFETAGYGFSGLMSGGLSSVFSTMVIRGFLSPFGHGLWCAMVSAGFWQSGRNPRAALRDRQFLYTLLKMVGLHALWNASFLGPLGPTVSAYITVTMFRKLLANGGYQR